MKKEKYDWGKTEPFFPDFLFKEALAALIFFVVLMLIVTFSHVPTEALADPTDTSYIPRPEWYFMFLFQLLKYFPGSLEPVAVIVLPTIGILLLLFLAFYDRRKERRPLKRPLASAAAAFGLVGIIFLTTVAIQTTPPPSATASAPAKKLTAAETAGRKEIQDLGCAACHMQGGVGPDFADVASRRDKEFITNYVKNPKASNPNSIMPSFSNLTDDQLSQLADYLMTLKK